MSTTTMTLATASADALELARLARTPREHLDAAAAYDALSAAANAAGDGPRAEFFDRCAASERRAAR